VFCWGGREPKAKVSTCFLDPTPNLLDAQGVIEGLVDVVGETRPALVEGSLRSLVAVGRLYAPLGTDGLLTLVLRGSGAFLAGKFLLGNVLVERRVKRTT
jgi:hypothetical protein